jgi:2-methylcitrate dehydratase PrpD
MEGENMPEREEKTAIQLIAENAVAARFGDLSEWNIRCTKDRIVDLTGCIIGGATAAGNAGLVKIVRDWGGKPEAPVFIHGGRVPLGNAAMVNCISSRSNDYGAMFANIDGRHIASHHAETTIPTALTFSDVYNVSGTEFLTATLVGDDTANRVLAAGEWDFSRGWDGTMTLPIFGAVPIAGRFMGLSPTQIKDAFGIAVNMIGGALQSLFDYSLCFKLGQGLSARNGIFAAELAREGWTGLEDALLGGKAYYYLYRGVEEIAHPELLTRDLGKKFYMEESFKRFPCGIPNSPFVYAGIAMHKAYGIKAGDICEVELALAPKGPGLYYAEPFRLGPAPQVNGIFSFQYTAVSALLRGRLKVQDFAPEAVCAPEILDVIAKSKIVRDPALSAASAQWGSVRLRVTTRDGRVYEKVQSAETSMHEYPTREEILAKFWDQVDAFHSISKAKAQKIVDMVERLEDVKEMREFTELLMPQTASSAAGPRA